MTTQVKPDRPLPIPTPLTKGFWDAAKERKLAIQKCTKCGHYNHPPEPICPKCHANDLSFIPVSGLGYIHSRVITHQAGVSGFQQIAPYAVIGVELEEQKGLIVLTNLVDAPVEQAQVGLPVEVTFEEGDGGFVFPQFRPRRGK